MKKLGIFEPLRVPKQGRRFRDGCRSDDPPHRRRDRGEGAQDRGEGHAEGRRRVLHGVRLKALSALPGRDRVRRRGRGKRSRDSNRKRVRIGSDPCGFPWGTCQDGGEPSPLPAVRPPIRNRHKQEPDGDADHDGDEARQDAFPVNRHSSIREAHGGLETSSPGSAVRRRCLSRCARRSRSSFRSSSTGIARPQTEQNQATVTAGGYSHLFDLEANSWSRVRAVMMMSRPVTKIIHGT